MPKYWVKNYFAHGRFPEVGQKQKTEKEKKEKDRKYVITMASYALQRHLVWRTQSRLGQFLTTLDINFLLTTVKIHKMILILNFCFHHHFKPLTLTESGIFLRNKKAGSGNLLIIF